MSRRSLRWVLIVLALLGGLVGFDGNPAQAVPTNDDQRPTTWAPTAIVTVMSNNSANVNYWFSWEGPASTSSNFWNWDDAVFEFGWKNTSYSGCDHSTWFLEWGFPSGMDIQVDWTEDNDDAVVWMDSIDQLRFDINANPGKEYAVAWDCLGSDHFDGSNAPNYQVAQNECDWPCEPWTTNTVNAMNYIPAEQGWKGVPAGSWDNRAIQTNMDAPWILNGNFESGAENWTTIWGSATSYTGNSNQGAKYIYLQPSSSGQGGGSGPYLKQDFRVRTGSTIDSSFELGSNTGLQYEGVFRCPTWAPGWAGLPGQSCQVRVWMKTDANSTWYYRDQVIPADWNWYLLLDANSPAMNSDDDIDIYIDTRGFPMDIDAQWVSSDI